MRIVHGMGRVERFWSKIARTKTCWIWTGTKKNSRGGPYYGVTSWTTRNAIAHRVAYELLRGPIPPGLTLDHLCRRTLCVNPDHLEPVTSAENTRRGGNAVKTHCPWGHPYGGNNLYIHHKSNGRLARLCLVCMQARTASRRARQKAERIAEGVRP